MLSDISVDLKNALQSQLKKDRSLKQILVAARDSTEKKCQRKLRNRLEWSLQSHFSLGISWIANDSEQVCPQLVIFVSVDRCNSSRLVRDNEDSLAGHGDTSIYL
jgi:hypothetical protein